MNLYIYTGATDLTEAAVTAANNLTAVTEFPALVYGDTEPLAIRFTTNATGTQPSWANVAGHVIDATVGELGSTGAERYAATSNFTYADNTYSGTIYLGTPGFASWVASRRNGKGWLDLQIRHTDTSGYIETLAVLTCPAWGSVPGDFSAETLPVSYATYADVLAAKTAAELAETNAETAETNAETAQAAAEVSAAAAAAVSGSGNGTFAAGTTVRVNGAGTTPNYASLSSALKVAGTSAAASMVIARDSDDSAPPRIVLAKSRAATVGGVTTVQNGDTIGQVYFSGADGTADKLSARLSVSVDGTVSTNVVPS